MAQADPRVKDIKIKTGVVRRLTKENEMYKKEVAEMGEKNEKMRKEGTDQCVMQKQEEILQESQNMVLNTAVKLKESYEELNTLLKKEDIVKDLAETEEYKTARKIVEAALAAIQSE